MTLRLGLLLLLALAGCKRDSERAIDLSKLRPGPIRGPLTQAQIQRLERIHRVFSDVDPTPLPKLEEDFSRDEHPDEEIKIWEAMADAYEPFAKGRTLDARTEAFGLLLIRSAAPTEKALEKPLKVLSREEAVQLLSAYRDVPAPIKVKAD
jgi:hypothetical protein